jgi:hypothetical protein
MIAGNIVPLHMRKTNRYQSDFKSQVPHPIIVQVVEERQA